MAYKLTWSPVARDDLRDLVRFIALDNPERAASFGLSLIQRVERLQNFPEMDRVVPDKKDPAIRELVIPPYRIVYRTSLSERMIEIVRIWHSARGNIEGI